LLNCYTIPLSGRKLRLGARDAEGRDHLVDVTDLRLFFFANGVGILCISAEAFGIPASEALWINEMMRKVYPSSGRQVREGRIPRAVWLSLEQDGTARTLVEETFQSGAMVAYQPPLSCTLTALLYFANYERQEFEPTLDERMTVYSYASLDPTSVPEGYAESEEYQVLLSRFLYVDQFGTRYRYDPEFTRKAVDGHVYRRWAHQGTYYGFTSYSSIALTVGVFDCDAHLLREGFLVHRMFRTRYFLIAVIALFYRATLLGFAERAALVSKQIYQDQADGRLSEENIQLTNRLRADFLHFSNYWLFGELANKDEEMEHYQLQCGVYRLREMRAESEEEIEKLNASLMDYYQTQSAVAVNRLAALSMVLGAGAVITGYFGMNFGREFGAYLFEPDGGESALHYATIVFVTVFALAALAFVVWLVAAHWSDYRDMFLSGRKKAASRSYSLRRGPQNSGQ
jgi:CorA-like Mg2+ transporter protein